MSILPGSKQRNSIKILLLGDKKVGKTSIARRFLGQDFSPLYHETIGVNISYIDYINPDDEQFTIMFWDLAGTERFKAMRRAYFEGAHGVFLIWDSSRPETRNDLYHWFEGIADDKLQDISVAVLANKIDLLEETDAKIEIADTLLTDLHIWSAIDFQTSALTGENINDALNWLSKECLFHVRKKKSELNSIFTASNFPAVMFKLTTAGVEPLFLDDIHLYHVPKIELEAYLITLGVKISFVTGQGENYTVGISNLIAGEGGSYRLLIYSFRLQDEDAEDVRLTNNYLQFVMFIADRYYPYFDSFRTVEPILKQYFSQYSSIKELSHDKVLEARNLVIEEFKNQSTL